MSGMARQKGTRRSGRWVLIALVLFALASWAGAQVSPSRVRSIGEKLEKKAWILEAHENIADEHEPLRFLVFPDATFHTKGQIVVSRHLLAEDLRNDDELAFVLAHALGHIIIGHLDKDALGNIKDEVGILIGEISSRGRQHFEIPEDLTNQEYLADILGVILTDCAGFDAGVAERILSWSASHSAICPNQDQSNRKIEILLVRKVEQQLRREGNIFCSSKGARP